MVGPIRQHRRQYACHSCTASFVNRAYLTKHLASHRLFTCQICKKSYGRRGHLLEHKKTHHTTKAFQCADCNLAFSSKAPLARHTKEVHDKERNFICTKCGTAFSRKENLESHMVRIHAIADEDC